MIMQWHGPILTDSADFRSFSHEEFMSSLTVLNSMRLITTGAWSYWTPETNAGCPRTWVQTLLCSLIQCVGFMPAQKVAETFKCMDREMLQGCRPDQALFGVSRAACILILRKRSIDAGHW